MVARRSKTGKGRIIRVVINVSFSSEIDGSEL